MAKRLQAMGQANYVDGFEPKLQDHMLELPLRWKKPQTIFVNSVLTKRSDRLVELDRYIEWPANVWMGVSVESKKYLPRIDHLRKTKAHVKFLSIEPLLEDLGTFDLAGMDWVIVGGESGPGARSMSPGWVRSLRELCVESDVPFFFKQWGGTRKKVSGRLLDGLTWDQMPQEPNASPFRIVATA